MHLSLVVSPCVVALALGSAHAVQLDSVTAYPATGVAYALLAHDLDGDGDVDLVRADYQSGRVAVFLNAGDGSFTAGVALDVLAGGQDLKAGDFDGDGFTDIAISHPVYDQLTLLFGDGTGAVDEVRTFPLIYSSRTMVVGDVDGDGFDDVVLGHVGNESAVRLHLSDGARGFRSVESLPLERVEALQLELSDTSHDGVRDLIALTEEAGQQRLLTWRGLAGGGFASMSARAVDGFAMTSGDFDGDGHVDVALLEGDLGLGVLYGDGAGGFGPQQTVTPETDAFYAFAAGDLDGDGVDELLTTGADEDGNHLLLVVYTSDGHGGFERALSEPLPPRDTYVIATADLNADGLDDVIAPATDLLYTLIAALPEPPHVARIVASSGLVTLGLRPSAVLTDRETSAPLAGRIVRFTTHGRPICTAITNTNGRAQCPLSVGALLAIVLASGSDATFDGDETYDAVSDHATALE